MKTPLRPIVLTLFLLGMVLPGLAAASRPNIVFILADDLGATDLACYGSKYYETPNIDRLAAEGARFTSGYSCGPNCQPTRAALMTGQYGPRSGVYTVGSIDRFNWRTRPLRPADNAEQLPLEKITLAQSLKKAGYATALFGKWHLGQTGQHHPRERGFDEAIVSMGKHFDFNTIPKTEYPAGTYLADFLTDKSLDFMRRHQSKPFFLCLHHFAVHSPHEAKTNLVERFRNKPPAGGHGNAVYAAMMASLDESVGRVIGFLKDSGLAENTVVIFSSDNGGVGGYAREGIKRAGDVTDNAPLRGGKGMLYEGGIRVPWIFRWPGKIEAARKVDEPILSVDLYPTLLELAGESTPSGQILDGISLAPLLLQKKPAPGRDLFWHFPGYLGAGQNSWRTTPVSVIRSGPWKLMEFLEDSRLELYNLADDKSETKNLSEQHPAQRTELAGKLKEWRERIGAPMPTRNAQP